MPLATALSVQLLADLTGATANAGIATAKSRHTLTPAYAFADGSTGYQASIIWSVKDRSIAASTFDTFDLSGSLLDAHNNAAVFGKGRIFALIASSSNAKPITIGGVANAFPLFGGSTQEHSVHPGGLALFVNPTSTGWTVTNGASDVLKINNTATSEAVKYSAAVIGSS